MDAHTNNVRLHSEGIPQNSVVIRVLYQTTQKKEMKEATLK